MKVKVYLRDGSVLEFRPHNIATTPELNEICNKGYRDEYTKISKSKLYLYDTRRPFAIFMMDNIAGYVIQEE